MIYDWIKNTPHFILLSFIAAELIVRFVYDSIYIPIKNKRSISSIPVTQSDEATFAKYYVTKLFRRNLRSNRRVDSPDVNIGNLAAFESEAVLQKKSNPSRVKNLLNSIYHWNDDFHFTTIVICTYTVAIIFLYYLACTLTFLYLSTTTSYISFVMETKFNIGRRIFLS
jgi:hypothetical protein